MYLPVPPETLNDFSDDVREVNSSLAETVSNLQRVEARPRKIRSEAAGLDFDELEQAAADHRRHEFDSWRSAFAEYTEAAELVEQLRDETRHAIDDAKQGLADAKLRVSEQLQSDGWTQEHSVPVFAGGLLLKTKLTGTVAKRDFEKNVVARSPQVVAAENKLDSLKRFRTKLKATAEQLAEQRSAALIRIEQLADKILGNSK